MDGPHQASSISPVAAPRSRPARIPSPVFPAAPVVHSVPIGARWYWRRICSSRSKPPVAISTPRRARISAGSPSRVARTPVTRPSVHLQARQRGVQPDRHAAGHQPGPQPRGQRLPHAEHPLPEQPGPRGPGRDPHRGADAPRMPAQAEPAVLGLGDGHGGGQVGPGEVGQFLAEHPPPVKRNGLDTAPRGQASRCLRVVVGVAGHPREAHRRLRQDQVEHVRAVLEQRLPPRGRDALGHVRQVGAGLLRRVRDPGGAQHRVARRPDTAAGAGRRPAEGPGLLDDQGTQPEVRRGQRGRHPGRAAARHHDVNLVHTRTRYSFAAG